MMLINPIDIPIFLQDLSLADGNTFLTSAHPYDL